MVGVGAPGSLAVLWTMRPAATLPVFFRKSITVSVLTGEGIGPATSQISALIEYGEPTGFSWPPACVSLALPKRVLNGHCNVGKGLKFARGGRFQHDPEAIFDLAEYDSHQCFSPEVSRYRAVIKIRRGFKTKR
jgi:hypothetical protein